MSLTIAGTAFDDTEYDERGDVLYLSVGAPREPARTVTTPEGHAIDYDESGAMIGMVWSTCASWSSGMARSR